MRQKIGLLFIVLSLLAGCSSLKKQPVKDLQASASSSRLTYAEEQQFYYYYYEALKLRDNQKYDQALEAFQLCYSIDSLNPGLNSDLSLFYISLGLVKEAVDHLETSVRLQPSNWWYNVRLIDLHANLKNYNRAIELAVNLQKKHPYKEEVYYTLASLYTRTGQPEKAIGAYDKMEKFAGVNEVLSLEKFRLYVEAGKEKKGIAEIDKLIQEYPAETRFRVLRGDIYLEKGNNQKALEIYEDVLKTDPENPYVYLSLSNYYNTSDQAEKASEYIVLALKNDLLDIETKMSILGQYIESLIESKKDIEETEDLFKLLIDRYPLEEQIHLYYATFLDFQKRDEDLTKELETILYINSKNDKAWMQLIQQCFATKDFNKMIEIASRAIQSLPADPKMYFYKSVAESQLKEYDTSLATCLQILPFLEKEESPQLKGDIYSHLGDVYYNMNKKEEAFEAYENSLKANPMNVYTMNNYAYYLSLEKENLRRAERLSAKTIEIEPENSTFLDTYAWILYHEGSYSLAKIYMERAIKYLDNKEEPGVILDHYGDILWKNGEKEKAVETWEKARDSGMNTEVLLKKIETKSLLEEVTTP